MKSHADPVPTLRPHEVMGVFSSVAAADGGGVSVLAVAHATGLSTLVVVPALAHLCERGLVARSAHASDGRTWVYHLTAAGQRTRRTSA